MEIMPPGVDKSQSKNSQGDEEERRESVEMNGRTADMQPPTPVRNKPSGFTEPPSEQSARHMFKIIDYGLADFEETFAAGPDVTLEVGVFGLEQRKQK